MSVRDYLAAAAFVALVAFTAGIAYGLWVAPDPAADTLSEQHAEIVSERARLNRVKTQLLEREANLDAFEAALEAHAARLDRRARDLASES